jgi:hypothetical protein
MNFFSNVMIFFFSITFIAFVRYERMICIFKTMFYLITLDWTVREMMFIIEAINVYCLGF